MADGDQLPARHLGNLKLPPEGQWTEFTCTSDDSGSRRVYGDETEPRRDGMDCFALGGILISEEAISTLLQAHASLTAKWKISYPLHSTKIRGRRDTFAWLGLDQSCEAEFLHDLERMILGLPIKGVACVVDKPGYVARYSEKFRQPWLLCKTAFAILIERAAKYSIRKNAQLRIFFEQAGENEDRDILKYARLLETEGMPFDPETSQGYESLRPSDFQSIILGQPNRITKKVPMAQIADLILYPMAKGGYDPTNAPYKKLLGGGCLVDSELTATDRSVLGVKLRFGAKGSKSVNLKKGIWYDHEAGEGGGPLDLIMRETGLTEPRQCYAWAERQGFWSNGGGPSPARFKVVAEYDYRDEGGTLLYQKRRWPPNARQRFTLRRPDANGGWINKLGDVRRVVYRLPEAVETIRHERTIFLVEGEKDVDNCWRIGVPATCNYEGAGKWNDQQTPLFAGADVCVITDNDEPGRAP